LCRAACLTQAPLSILKNRACASLRLPYHPTVSGKRLLQIRAKFLHPFAKKVLVDLDVPRRLSHTYATLTHQPDLLDLEVSAELAPQHRSPSSFLKQPISVSMEPAARHATKISPSTSR
jgi:hypothetical protein